MIQELCCLFALTITNKYAYILQSDVMLAFFTPKLLKRFLDILWWWFFVSSVVLYLLAVLYFLIFPEDYSRLGFAGIPLSYKGISVPALDLGSGVMADRPMELRAEVSVRSNFQGGSGYPIIWFLGLKTLLEIIIILAILYHARRFIREIVQKNFFIRANVDRLKWMGHLSFANMMLSLIHLLFLWLYMAYNGLLQERIFIDSGETWKIIMEGLISVFVCYMFAGIFQYGLKLKKDQELTI